jgi:PAS domain S-box-containing protein
MPLRSVSQDQVSKSKAGLDGIFSLLSAIVDSSHDAIVSNTLDGIVTSWNPAAEQMFGYTAAEAVGQSIRLIIPADRQAEEDYVLSKVDGVKKSNISKPHAKEKMAAEYISRLPFRP